METGSPELIVGNAVVFTGEDKLVREAVGYEQQTAEAALSHIGFREPTFRRRLDIGDPQSSPTKLTVIPERPRHQRPDR